MRDELEHWRSIKEVHDIILVAQISTSIIWSYEIQLTNGFELLSMRNSDWFTNSNIWRSWKGDKDEAHMLDNFYFIFLIKKLGWGMTLRSKAEKIFMLKECSQKYLHLSPFKNEFYES